MAVSSAVPEPHRIKRYGWRPDLKDQRDYLFLPPETTVATLPRHVSLQPACPPVVDQDQLGSCTANAIAQLMRFVELKQQDPTPDLGSRLFLYYNERDMEGSAGYDSGAMIRDGMKSVANQGICDETLWPYRISLFAQKPPQAAYDAALRTRAIQYLRVQQDLTHMEACLADGYPFVFGFTVYESFESDGVAHTGMVPMPGRREPVLGGHAVMAVGYDTMSQRFIVMNSWGTGWGDHGYFTIPFAYLKSTSLASDFWTLRLVQDQ